jgi:riboflavin biosynthesis protein
MINNIKMDVATYKKLFSEDDAVGWEAMDKSLEALYPIKNLSIMLQTFQHRWEGTLI